MLISYKLLYISVLILLPNTKTVCINAKSLPDSSKPNGRRYSKVDTQTTKTNIRTSIPNEPELYTLPKPITPLGASPRPYIPYINDIEYDLRLRQLMEELVLKSRLDNQQQTIETLLPPNFKDEYNKLVQPSIQVQSNLDVSKNKSDQISAANTRPIQNSSNASWQTSFKRQQIESSFMKDSHLDFVILEYMKNAKQNLTVILNNLKNNATANDDNSISATNAQKIRQQLAFLQKNAEKFKKFQQVQERTKNTTQSQWAVLREIDKIQQISLTSALANLDVRKNSTNSNENNHNYTDISVANIETHLEEQSLDSNSKIQNVIIGESSYINGNKYKIHDPRTPEDYSVVLGSDHKQLIETFSNESKFNADSLDKEKNIYVHSDTIRDIKDPSTQESKLSAVNMNLSYISTDDLNSTSTKENTTAINSSAASNMENIMLPLPILWANKSETNKIVPIINTNIETYHEDTTVSNIVNGDDSTNIDNYQEETSTAYINYLDNESNDSLKNNVIFKAEEQVENISELITPLKYQAETKEKYNPLIQYNLKLLGDPNNEEETTTTESIFSATTLSQNYSTDIPLEGPTLPRKKPSSEVLQKWTPVEQTQGDKNTSTNTKLSQDDKNHVPLERPTLQIINSSTEVLPKWSSFEQTQGDENTLDDKKKIFKWEDLKFDENINPMLQLQAKDSATQIDPFLLAEGTTESAKPSQQILTEYQKGLDGALLDYATDNTPAPTADIEVPKLYQTQMLSEHTNTTQPFKSEPDEPFNKTKIPEPKNNTKTLSPISTELRYSESNADTPIGTSRPDDNIIENSIQQNASKIKYEYLWQTENFLTTELPTSSTETIDDITSYTEFDAQQNDATITESPTTDAPTTIAVSRYQTTKQQSIDDDIEFYVEFVKQQTDTTNELATTTEIYSPESTTEPIMATTDLPTTIYEFNFQTTVNPNNNNFLLKSEDSTTDLPDNNQTDMPTTTDKTYSNELATTDLPTTIYELNFQATVNPNNNDFPLKNEDSTTDLPDNNQTDIPTTTEETYSNELATTDLPTTIYELNFRTTVNLNNNDFPLKNEDSTTELPDNHQTDIPTTTEEIYSNELATTNLPSIDDMSSFQTKNLLTVPTELPIVQQEIDMITDNLPTTHTTELPITFDEMINATNEPTSNDIVISIYDADSFLGDSTTETPKPTELTYQAAIEMSAKNAAFSEMSKNLTLTDAGNMTQDKLPVVVSKNTLLNPSPMKSTSYGQRESVTEIVWLTQSSSYQKPSIIIENIPYHKSTPGPLILNFNDQPSTASVAILKPDETTENLDKLTKIIGNSLQDSAYANKQLKHKEDHTNTDVQHKVKRKQQQLLVKVQEDVTSTVNCHTQTMQLPEPSSTAAAFQFSLEAATQNNRNIVMDKTIENQKQSNGKWSTLKNNQLNNDSLPKADNADKTEKNAYVNANTDAVADVNVNDSDGDDDDDDDYNADNDKATTTATFTDDNDMRLQMKVDMNMDNETDNGNGNEDENNNPNARIDIGAAMTKTTAIGQEYSTNNEFKVSPIEGGINEMTTIDNKLLSNISKHKSIDMTNTTTTTTPSMSTSTYDKHEIINKSNKKVFINNGNEDKNIKNYNNSTYGIEQNLDEVYKEIDNDDDENDDDDDDDYNELKEILTIPDDILKAQPFPDITPYHSNSNGDKQIFASAQTKEEITTTNWWHSLPYAEIRKFLNTIFESVTSSSDVRSVDTMVTTATTATPTSKTRVKSMTERKPKEQWSSLIFNYIWSILL